MGYTALYRKYRPKTFEEVAGQDAIKRTLINQIINDRIGHAYLFCGSRGTGKTTVARIFARAVNCLKPENGSPCEVCDICRIEDNIDIIEIDGASSNGVDAIRELKEQVKYPPVNSKYKVYIIDEVHMLTASSYNALLKTLEEPPEYVIFILATTEPHEIPPTIMSRCMRFDFKLVPTEKIAEIISYVFNSSNIKASKEAIELIARSGLGSVRDALSIADMCAGFSAKEVTYGDVLELLGGADIKQIGALAAHILKGDLNNCLAIVNSLAETGKSINIITRDLTTYFRNMGVVKTCKNPNDILGLPLEVLSQIQEHSTLADLDKITVCIDIFSSLDQDLRFGLNPRITLENAIIKAARLLINTPNAVLAKLNELENKLNDLKYAPKISEQPNGQPNFNEPKIEKLISEQKQDKKEQIAQDASEKVIEDIPFADLVPPEKQGHFIAPEDIFDEQESSYRSADKTLGELAFKLRENGEHLLYYQVTNNLEKIKLEKDALVVTVADKNSYKLLNEPKSIQIIESFLDGLKFKAVLGEKQPEITEERIKKLKDLAGNKLIVK
ncbi:MAG TPA: DNA polymerase III subunit gamma/tau [Clostridia bacterium]|jgi:DNA polymerase-3 subunit gamma/tau